MKENKILQIIFLSPFLLILGSNLHARMSTKNPAVERGKFILYKYLLPIGTETYEISTEGDSGWR